MDYTVLIDVAVIAALGLPFVLKRRRDKARTPTRTTAAARPAGLAEPQGRRQPASPEASPARPQDATPAPAAERAGITRQASPQLEAMLRDFHPTLLEDLPAGEAATVMALLDRIPRPPSALHKLVSPTFLANASAAELSEMVMAEPQVAAKVLAVVNSPLYGLQAPLASIGQAVTFLGMNTVRGICLQYLLNESFQAGDPEIKRIFDNLWNASACASELAQRLSRQLQLPDQGALVTQVVLSFLGPMTSHALLPRPVALAMAGKTYLERSRLEQEHLGLCAAELGALLMRKWELPDNVVTPVREMDRVLLSPCGEPPSARQARMAFGYLCARLGKQLARGSVTDLGSYVIAQDRSADLFHLQGYLQQPGLERLQEALHRPEVVGSLQAMVASMQERR